MAMNNATTNAPKSRPFAHLSDEELYEKARKLIAELDSAEAEWLNLYRRALHIARASVSQFEDRERAKAVLKRITHADI